MQQGERYYRVDWKVLRGNNPNRYRVAHTWTIARTEAEAERQVIEGHASQRLIDVKAKPSELGK